MNKILFILLSVCVGKACATTDSLAQNNVGDVQRKIYFFVDESPLFSGGVEELKKYFAKNLSYPKIAKEKGIEGVVHIRFEIKKDGSVGKIIISKSAHPTLDVEAVRVIKEMPLWLPGRFRGEVVGSWCSLPVRFYIQR